MLRSLLAALLILPSTGVSAAEYRDRSVPMSVETDLDVKRYMGRWYEIARFPNRFEKGCQGVTADYALREDGKVRVVNTCRKGAPDGPAEQARGVARVAAPGRLEVTFVPFLSFLPFLWGDYWVLDVTEDYDVAVIGNPDGSTGWILARDPQIDERTFQAAAKVLQKNGYDTSALKRVPQLEE
ncbi:apolipoprotein D and lipocalin family protein [Cribrihabitans marinus]|uniref:Outer membrane lipoprotein Blc n=1 Tax=Cribrihabitans marinus TaxID=1227549 RepID=A0A1H7A785_9RHOB|nr:lipocalin family protein [Cribrihabitans marinus]GGH29844.1 lipocalin [Cribrihabitans marinus]SEJ57912.1 apolipoprotein D and lipocalin family protein [Cribrihabitans marinus]